MLYTIFALAATLACAVRFQTESPSAPEPPEAENDTSKTDLQPLVEEAPKIDFQLPKECSEVCPDKRSFFDKVFQLKQKYRYKCILKDHTKLPPGCNDRDAKLRRRKSSRAQYKISCPFGTKALAKQALQVIPKKCSEEMKCCCNSAERLSFRTCLPMHITDEIVFHPSILSPDNPRAFKRISQTYSNPGECVNVTDPLKYQLAEDDELSDHGKCCIETELSPNVSGTEARYTMCTKFEQLYHCSPLDDHSTQIGQFYQKITDGQCLGDRSPGDLKITRATALHDFKCPKGFYAPKASDACACKVECD
mmetsp:Transcript_81971/g.213460  ORF Transcript_81971/g.213460 Transcript_81971/m.213460 type:complete len:308 (+) Transcript_81971:81-1004(+)